MNNNQIPKKDDIEFFGIVRWCEEDIEDALSRFGYNPTPEMVAIIRNCCNHHFFTDYMIEAGWHMIEGYISENGDRLDAIAEREV